MQRYVKKSLKKYLVKFGGNVKIVLYLHCLITTKFSNMTTYKHPKELHELAMTIPHSEMNVKLSEAGYVKQEKGGFWIEHRSYAINEHGKRINRRIKKVSRFTGRWENKQNRVAVKSDILARVQSKNISSAVCLPSVSPDVVVRTFKAFGIKNLHGFEIKRKEYLTAVKRLKKSNLKNAIVMCEGDVLNHLDNFKKGFFVEADFCGKITTYKKFFSNLPAYWSLTVCKARYGGADKIIRDFARYMKAKVSKGKTVKVQKDGGEYEYTKLFIGDKKYHLYEYGDPNSETGKCSRMFVISNI